MNNLALLCHKDAGAPDLDAYGLYDLLRSSAEHQPEQLAIVGPGGSLTYAQLHDGAWRLANELKRLGVRAGDRVGIFAEKQVWTVLAMQACLLADAVYVPMNYDTPIARAKTIAEESQMALVVGDERATTEWGREAPMPWLSLAEVEAIAQDAGRPASGALPQRKGSDLAYILFTSGSTGKPKGVCITHRNALAFVFWAGQITEATSRDRFSSHAPFSFDLSVFDLYVCFLASATVYLLPETIAYAPRPLVQFLIRHRISIWYSVPSALILMAQQGKLFEEGPLPLRVLVFAGEVFPPADLSLFVERYPQVRFLNFYGPTETNVCTYYEVREAPGTEPIPIGEACSWDRAWAQKEDGSVAEVGEEGLLWIDGPTVMAGYWGKEPHVGPYSTGDLVKVLPGGNYRYIGRVDHLVKVKGYRVELGEIEAILASAETVSQAVVLVVGTGLEAKLIGFVVPAPDQTPSLLGLKRHSANFLPRYMIIDQLVKVETLPLTSHGKVNRAALLATYQQRETEKAPKE